MDEFLLKVKEENENIEIKSEEKVFDSILKSYERVIFETLISTFGLDFIKDQKGGDVDTIYNVRNNPGEYKNIKNLKNYQNRGDYNTAEYHSDERFTQIKHNARAEFDSNGSKLDDEYVLGNKLIPRNNNTIPRNQQAQLDHIMPAEKIHNDPGRVLAGLSGLDLANDKDNLAFTNADLNRNKSNMSVDEYLKWAEEHPDKVNWNGNKGEEIPEEVKTQLEKKYKEAEKKYNDKINRAYYTSKQFWQDTAFAAGKVGVQMGVRQVLGFVFAEVWFVTKEEMEKVPPSCGLDEILLAVGRGIEKGFKSALSKYDEMLNRFGEGFQAGALASLTTTICNIFFTTSKKLVFNIRQIYASVVRATDVLLFNPDDLFLGERIKTSAVILATGASVLAGTAIGGSLTALGVGKIPVVGAMIIQFTSCLISGLLSCSFLIFMDRSKFINDMVDRLNELPTEVTRMDVVLDIINKYSADLAQIDVEQFEKDTMQYQLTAELISNASNDEELNQALEKTYSHFNIPIPWKGDFDDFMSDRNNTLVFE